MHWKKYKALSRAEKSDEAYYIIGLDIGNDSSGIAFYNMAEGAPEIIDLSGGYGRPSIPTVMQYISDTREWVYGEYAILNRGVGTEITLSSLISRLGNFEYIDLDHRPVSVVSVLGLFIKELLGNVKNINPKAEIVGIVAAVPGYFSGQAREELSRAFKTAGYEKELIAMVPDRECIFTRYYQKHKPVEERTLLLDYGSREVRGGLYHISPQGGTVSIKSMSSLFDDAIGTAKINDDVVRLFESFLAANQLPTTLGRQINEHIAAFVYQHKDLLFQKAIRSKPLKLFFNFAYPPFQQTVNANHAERLTKPYLQQFNRFIKDVLEKNLYGDGEITPGDINNVLCVGGGFEMLWAREAVDFIFRNAQTHFYKNTKVVTAEGAATVAALMLDAIDGCAVTIEDKHQLSADIGVESGSSLSQPFLPLAERNSFWWQKHPMKLLLINHPCDGGLPLELAARNAEGDLRKLASLQLTGLPKRPKGATRLSVQLVFSSNEDVTVKVKDLGFGELFPKVEGYEKNFKISI